LEPTTRPSPSERLASIDFYARVAAVALLVAGCFVVLRPFVAAMLFAGVVCATTWPVYKELRSRLGDRSSIAALLMVLALVLLIVVPLAILAASFAGNVAAFAEALQRWFATGIPGPPGWVAGIPFVGEQISEQWQAISSSPEELRRIGRMMLEPARKALLGLGAILGNGVLEMLIVVFVGFFFYRDGEAIMHAVRSGVERVAGHLSGDLLRQVQGTVVSVVYGILGTALAQGAVATIGFLIAGVPAALTLGFATFLLSLVPVGPPLVWGGAAIWLYYQDSLGWAIFMVLWGALVVSSIDNFLKPLLISRGSKMSLLLVALGVFGGLLAFGFIGIFLGPALLATGLSVAQYWVRQSAEAGPAGGPP